MQRELTSETRISACILRATWMGKFSAKPPSTNRETSLEDALRLAQQAATRSPAFGFAWERVAELEFSFGRTPDALEALNKSLRLATLTQRAGARVEGVSTRGAKSNTAPPSDGLTRRSRRILRWATPGLGGDFAASAPATRRADARICSWPPRSNRSAPNCGVIWARPSRMRVTSAHATNEFRLAKKLDPNDPTAWLYSALLDQQDNLINDAIRDLEKSEELNDNRSVYRSQLLLDQDQAVRAPTWRRCIRTRGCSM